MEAQDVGGDKHKNLEVEDAELNTPLLMAAAEGNSEAMGVLIKEGAKLTQTDGKGNNIVHLMVSNDKANVLKVSGLMYLHTGIGKNQSRNQ